ncbi:MAG: hypothetical protein GQ574_22630 [Crocinitomix sp.]|nr:hypothetical protein [Crocinitomix sp.]
MTADIVKIKIVETKAFTLYRLENNILFFDYLNNIVINLDDIKEAFDLFIEHSEGMSFKVLLAFGQFSSISAEARKYAENKSMPTPAQAFIIRNLAQRMLAKFYHVFRKDDHPLKFFGKVEEALLWLESI